MAESQDSFDYTADILAAVEDSLSSARLLPYVKLAKGDRAFALQYYLWNARLAKAFLFPLQIAEVAARNAIYNAIAAKFGADWLTAQPFELTPESEQSLRRALDRLPPNPEAGKIVAALTFDFWSNLFRRNYEAIWPSSQLTAAFPNAPVGTQRHNIQMLVADINRLRNRIAHHEPIHQEDHRKELTQIITLIGYCSAKVEEWTRKHTTVMAIVRSPPTSAASKPGRPLASTNLRPPPSLHLASKLDEVAVTVASARPALALVKTDSDYHIITAARLMAYIAAMAARAEGLIDLTEHDVAALVTETPDIPFAKLAKSRSTGDVTTLFFPSGKAKDRPQVIIVTDDAGEPVGAMMRPELRY